jgi:hypothetical protein
MKRTALVLLMTFVLLVTLHYASAADVTRSFTSTDVYYNELVTVNMGVSVTGENKYVYVIDEDYPSGWTVTDRGVGNTNQSGHIKWVYYSNITPAEDIAYYYIVRAPAVSGNHDFSGSYIFENMSNSAEILNAGNGYVTVSNPCVDLDGDLYDNCNPSSPYDDDLQIDCNDNNPDINPGEQETCNNIDDDCDGTIDYFEQNCGPQNETGICSYGTQQCVAGSWESCSGEQDSVPEICNQLDDDCDGIYDDVNDGSSVAETSCQCYDGGIPYADEQCPLNNIDDDCDSIIDTNDCDCFEGEQQPCSLQAGVCVGSYEVCPADLVWDGCNASIYELFNPAYNETETECDNLDNNCNNQTDEGLLNTYYADQDADGYGDLSNTIEDCTQPGGYVINFEDCNDQNSSINPDATEICDGVNNDCDGQTDEGCAVPANITNTYYDGSTTDFSAVSNFSNIQNMIMEKIGYGKIVFNENINVQNSISIDPPGTIIAQNRAMINSTRLPMLNRSANISLYNITLNNPTILRDGAECSGSVCTLIDYMNDVFEFSVTHFSEYSTQGRCDDGTWYDQCVSERTGNDGDKPKYCEDGSIISKASVCGCPSGQSVSGENCVTPSTNGGNGNGGGGGGACIEGQTSPCSPAGTTAGVCEEHGYQTCRNGVWSSCEGAILPSDEVCDGLDNDCDGETDEDVNCLCTHGDKRPCGSDVGTCTRGTSTCSYGEWGECSGGIPAKVVEDCFNDLDDDCDGEVNNGCEDIAVTCSNNIQDGNEYGVDCGGVCLNPCPIPLEIPPYTGLLMIIAGLVLLFVLVLWDLWKAKRGY